MRIFLIGMPGAGKSTIGKDLAKVTGLFFADLDQLIEGKEEMEIHEIFQKKGEDEFRRIESSVLTAFIDKHDSFILAAGGGTPCFHNNMELMNASGVTVFLHADIPVLVKRLSDVEIAKRPLLENPDMKMHQRIELLAKQRLPFYTRAKLVVKADANATDHILRDLNFEP